MDNLPTPLLAQCLVLAGFKINKVPNKTWVAAVQFMGRHPVMFADWLIESFGRHDAPWKAVLKCGDANHDTPQVMRALIQRGCSVREYKVLMTAAKRGCVDTVREILVDAGVRADTRLLANAAGCGHINVINMLIEAGADATVALKTAVYCDNASVVPALIKAGADVNRGSPDPPLVIAATNRNADMTRVLIECGADVRHSHRPIIIAVNFGLSRVLRALLEAGADANIPEVTERVYAPARIWGVLEEFGVIDSV